MHSPALSFLKRLWCRKQEEQKTVQKNTEKQAVLNTGRVWKLLDLNLSIFVY